jgi:hypothetical protein
MVLFFATLAGNFFADFFADFAALRRVFAMPRLLSIWAQCRRKSICATGPGQCW